MKTLYHGFDGLDVTFQGCAPARFLDLLERAKQEAQAKEQAVTVTYKAATFDVAATGAVGFSYRLDTGPDGETWFIAKSQKPHGWNLRVSVKSMALALNGFAAIRARLFRWLEIIGADVRAYSIGRVDFAVDVEVPDFRLNPDRLVCHWRTSTAQVRHQRKEATLDEFGQEVEIRGNGGTINSLTVGKMPGRQVIIYDKRREVIDRRKLYWWRIWYPSENLDDPETLEAVKKRRVWRVEIRAGKRLLKERWNVSTFEDLEAYLPAILTEALDTVRLHADDQTDSNVSRQVTHDLWQLVANLAAYPFDESDRIEARPVVVEAQAAMREKYESLVAGLAASYAVVCEVSAEDAAEEIAAGIMDAIRTRIKVFPGKFRDAHERAQKRLRFMKDAEAWQSVGLAA